MPSRQQAPQNGWPSSMLPHAGQQQPAPSVGRVTPTTRINTNHVQPQHTVPSQANSPPRAVPSPYQQYLHSAPSNTAAFVTPRSPGVLNWQQAQGQTRASWNTQSNQTVHRHSESMHSPASASQQQNPAQNPNAAQLGHGTPLNRLSSDAASILVNHWRNTVVRQTQELQKDGSLNHPVERPRYHLLIDACGRGDVFYLLFHQVFCLWTLNKSEVHKLLNFDITMIDEALEKLTSVLKPTDAMALRHITWLARFPPSWTDSRLPQGLFQQVVSQVAEFIRSFSTRWDSLRADVQRRNYPIMAWEASQVLQCHSLILSELLFTFLRRTLGCDDGLIGNELIQHFTEDTQNESRRGFMVAPTVDATVDKHRQEMSIRYSTLLALGQRKSAQRRWRENQPATPSTQPQAGSTPSHGQAAAPHTPISASQAIVPRESSPQASSSSTDAQRPTPTAAVARLATRHASGISQPAIAASTTTATTSTSLPYTLVQPQQQAPATSQPPSSVTQDAPATDKTTSPSSPQTRSVNGLPDDAALYILDPDTPSEKWVREVLARSADLRIPINYHGRSPYDWTSIRTSLHLVGSRSPRRVPAKPNQSRFYQSLAHFAAEPREAPAALGIKILQFEMTDAEMQMLPCKMPGHEAVSTPVVSYFENSRRYRLRLCKVDSTTKTITDAEWAVLPSFWPENIQVRFNDTAVQLQRKHHFHFDLPVELTSLVKPGLNTVQISLPDSKSNLIEGLTFFAAVEVLTTLSHESVIGLIQRSQHYTLEQTRNEISKRQRFSGQGDDDLMITGDSLVVTVADPFTSSIFDIPVRGTNCHHLECFDLNNWLQTRPSKTNIIAEDSRQEPSLADNWRCPLCGEDARPQSLRIDELFVGIRSILESEKKLDVKKIKISSSGNWMALDESSRLSVDRQRPRTQEDLKSERRAIITSTTEVIELGDD